MSLLHWAEKYGMFHKHDNDIMQRWYEVRTEIIAPMIKYKIPVITLSKEVKKAAVCQVFEKVNTGGVALTMFELVVASFAAEEFKLREDWEKRYGAMTEKRPLLSVFEKTPENFLIAVILLARYKTTGKLPTFKRNDILKLPLKHYEEFADDIEYGFKEAAGFLREEKIFDKRELPYAAQLIPLAVIFAILKNDAKDKAKRDKLSQWFWCGIFGELYGHAAESRFAKDIVGMLDWIKGGEEKPETIIRAEFSPIRLLELRTRTNVPYKGITALILQNNARDFVSGSRIDDTFFLEQNIDIHHIFPKAWCKGKFDERKWDSVVNKTPLSVRSNQHIIRGDAPSVYLHRIRKDDRVQSDAEIDELLKTHIIEPTDMWSDNFDAYFIRRAKALLGLISKAMGKEITGLDSQEVIEAYGVSLKDS